MSAGPALPVDLQEAYATERKHPDGLRAVYELGVSHGVAMGEHDARLSPDPKVNELVEAARAFVHFSFADEEAAAEREGRSVSSVPFVQREQRLRRAVRALEEP